MKKGKVKEFFEEVIECWPITILVVCLLIVTGVLLSGGSVFGDTEAIHETTTETVSILGVSFQESTEGHFALGYGFIRGEEYYACFQKDEDGGISLLKLNADVTTIYPTLSDNEEAYAVMEIGLLESINSAKLYVPANTIQKQFDFSLGS